VHAVLASSWRFNFAPSPVLRQHALTVGLAAAILLAAGAVLGLAILLAVAPAAGFGLAGTAAAAGAAWSERERLRASPRARRAVTIALLAAAVATFAAAVGATGVALAAWPATVGLLVVVGTILLVAWRAPAWALAGGLLLIAFEGSVKLLLELEPTPLPASARAAGAALIDVALFGAVAAVLYADRLRTPRALWRGASEGERIALSLLGGWLVLSAVQIAWDLRLERGIEGFRLFQAYTAVGLAAAVVAIRVRTVRPVLAAVLAITLVVSLYAAVRVAIGPAQAEEEFATSVATTTRYGGRLRAIGSFSSSVGMVSLLTPCAVFGIVAGYLVPRLRLFAWTGSALAFVGILGGYGRAPLFGIAAGLLFTLVVLVASGDLTRRRKLATGVLVVVAIVVAFGGVYLVGRGSAQLEERARGAVNPTADASVRLRFDNWEHLLGTVDEHPLGRGLGAVGAASSDQRATIVTSDNSFLKVLIEQGIPGLALFLAGLVLTIGVLARRLLRASGERRALGVAALAGFVGFLALSVSGEYVEQPGKAAAWALLGLAVATALGPAEGREEQAR
jgi:O-antigen ligase